jgi:predicted TPR repeat methyltransferase
MTGEGAAPGEGQLGIPEAMERAVALQKEGDLDSAEELYRRILAVVPDHADAWHFRGLAALQRGDEEQAVALIRKATELAPDYADAHNNLGNVLLMAKRYEEATACYRRAVALKPDMAEAHFNLGRGYEASRRIDEALAAFRAGLALAPGHFESYRRLAGLFYSAGRVEEAVRVYREWAALEPDNEYVQHMLAACTDTGVPDRASDACVQTIFDRFADTFDEHLAVLKYQAPALVMEACKRVAGPAAGALEVLDAGCGTGLCGPLLKPHARRLVGVDLSPEMVKHAARRGVYDELEVAELTAFLAGRPSAWDLIACADTLVYFGELAPVMAAVATTLRPGGHFVFTVERAPEVDGSRGHRLNPNGRYSHTDAYVRQVVSGAGLTPVLIAAGFLRVELDVPVPGLVVAARR